MPLGAVFDHKHIPRLFIIFLSLIALWMALLFLADGLSEMLFPNPDMPYGTELGDIYTSRLYYVTYCLIRGAALAFALACGVLLFRRYPYVGCIPLVLIILDTLGSAFAGLRM